MKKIHSIRFSLSLVVAIIILISVFLSTTLSYSRYINDFQQQSSEQIEQTLEQLAINLSAYLDELFRLTAYIYYDNKVISAIETTGGTSAERLQRRRVIENYLDQIMIMPRKDILNVFVMTDDIFFSGRMPKSINYNTDYESFDWYHEAMTTIQPIFVPPHFELLVSYPKDTVFSIVKQLRSVQNIDEIIGVIKVDASYSGIADIAQKINMGEDGGIFIIDENKNLIYHDIPIEKESSLEHSALASKGSWTQKIEDTEYLMNTVKVEGANWTIVSVNSLDELTKNAQRTRNFAFIFAALNSFLAIIVLLIFTNNFLQPLMHIVALMKEVRKGDFNVSFLSTRNDEIGYLGDSFNSMVKTINDNIEQNTKLATKIYQAEMLQTEAQLNALHNQIKPHFLYNTLNMISMQIQIGKQEQAVDNINKLHSLLRRFARLDKEILVKDEFSVLNAYLAIQSSRFEERLSYNMKLDKEMGQQYILAFILQPIVENAVIHGCEAQREKITITVEGFIKDNRSYFIIKDNGKGITDDKLSDMNETLKKPTQIKREDHPKNGGGHIGLENVNTRIKIRYGSIYGISLKSKVNVGTEIIVSLPLLREGLNKDV